MRRILVDTSAWGAIADSNDPNHEIALLFQEEITGRCQLVITNYILDELLTLLLMNLGYKHTVDLKRTLDALVREGILEIVWVSEVICDAAWRAFEQFNIDKEWSFTDCVSYVVMKRHQILEAFAFDHHFDQMGFTRRP
jgi:predicted nucleic acid-binding protein